MSSSSNTKVTTVDSPGSNDTLGGGEKYITYMWEGLIEIQRHHGGKGEREGEGGGGGTIVVRGEIRGVGFIRR